MSTVRQPGLVVKLRPTGPWRVGPDSGARDAVDPLYHSDSLYSAVTSALRLMGMMEPWLEATARNPAGPAVRFSSLFPFQNELGFVVPPRSVWPPPASTKVRWKGARFIPLGLIAPLLDGRGLGEDQWDVDGASECLVPAGRPGPFRPGMRTAAAVDRLTGHVAPHATACVEFLPDAGLWAVIAFADDQQNERWNGLVRAAFRLLADTGLGGERGRGWGRAESPEFIEGSLPDMILPNRQPPVADAAPSPSATQPEPALSESEASGPTADVELPAESPAPAERVVESPVAYWLLSLFSPAEGDSVDWNRGNYALVSRVGRIESPARSGDLKKTVNMVGEGSVLVASSPVQGAAPDVAPDDFAHPVYRAGFALAIPIPWQAA